MRERAESCGRALKAELAGFEASAEASAAKILRAKQRRESALRARDAAALSDREEMIAAHEAALDEARVARASAASAAAAEHAATLAALSGERAAAEAAKRAAEEALAEGTVAHALAQRKRLAQMRELDARLQGEHGSVEVLHERLAALTSSNETLEVSVAELRQAAAKRPQRARRGSSGSAESGGINIQTADSAHGSGSIRVVAGEAETGPAGSVVVAGGDSEANLGGAVAVRGGAGVFRPRRPRVPLVVQKAEGPGQGA